MGSEQIRNVVLVGHSGSGKTALAEALLFTAGVTWDPMPGPPWRDGTPCSAAIFRTSGDDFVFTRSSSVATPPAGAGEAAGGAGGGPGTAGVAGAEAGGAAASGAAAGAAASGAAAGAEASGAAVSGAAAGAAAPSPILATSR